MTLSVSVKKKLGKFTLDVSFESGTGILALLGASGSGKSMTLKCIAGIEIPDEGRIELDGRVLFDSDKRINIPARERRIGFLFQHYALFPNMTALENVMAAARGTRAEKKLIAEKRLASMYLLDCKDKYPAQLSGGQQQRVALSRMLVCEPEAILLDEPLSALDSYLKWQLEMELVDIFRGFDRPVIYVTHNRNEVYRISDDVCVLESGNSENVVPTQDMFLKPRTLAAALISGCKNFSHARKTGDHSIFAEDWGVELEVAAAVPDSVKHIGVRSHAVKVAVESDSQNVFTCRIDKVVREMFSVIAMLSPILSKHGSNYSAIRIKMINGKWEDVGSPCVSSVLEISINPNEILLLE